MEFIWSDDRELRQLQQQVAADPDEFEGWAKLIQAAETQEGGLTRNSNPQAIAVAREAYDSFLARFPLLFGYWKKYAELEWNIGGTETAEMVYERGVVSVRSAVELWNCYCAFKITSCHDFDAIRELFERAVDAVGLDMLSSSLWENYIAWEKQHEHRDRVFALYNRVIHIPLQHYTHFADEHRRLVTTRPIAELLTAEEIKDLRKEVESHYRRQLNDTEMENQIRHRVGALAKEIEARTKQETSRRLDFEQFQVNYFNVTELPSTDLILWRRYLTFEEVEGNPLRIKQLYERCVTVAAKYDEFWFRYARWTAGQRDKPEEVIIEELRFIYQRACCFHVPTCRPEIRLLYARFEESVGNEAAAVDVHEAILEALPGNTTVMTSLANLHRRLSGFDAAIAWLEKGVDEHESPLVRGHLVTEIARMTWDKTQDVSTAMQCFEKNKVRASNSQSFWTGWFRFQLSQPLFNKKKMKPSVQELYHEIRTTASLPADVIAIVTAKYLEYLTELGDKNAMKEYVKVDQETFGPLSAALDRKVRLAEDGQLSTTERRMVAENGHPGLAVDEAHIRRGGNAYTQYYAEQGDLMAD